jgi:hypothetical protein
MSPLSAGRTSRIVYRKNPQARNLNGRWEQKGRDDCFACPAFLSFFDNKQLYRLCSHITYQTFEEVCITDRSNDQNAAATKTTMKTNTPAES